MLVTRVRIPTFRRVELERARNGSGREADVDRTEFTGTRVEPCLLVLRRLQQLIEIRDRSVVKVRRGGPDAVERSRPVPEQIRLLRHLQDELLTLLVQIGDRVAAADAACGCIG